MRRRTCLLTISKTKGDEAPTLLTRSPSVALWHLCSARRAGQTWMLIPRLYIFPWSNPACPDFLLGQCAKTSKYQYRASCSSASVANTRIQSNLRKNLDCLTVQGATVSNVGKAKPCQQKQEAAGNMSSSWEVEKQEVGWHYKSSDAMMCLLLQCSTSINFPNRATNWSSSV